MVPQSFAPWQVVAFLFGGDCLDLKNIALLIIYEDGYIDYLNIDDEKYHYFYYKKLVESSIRFNDLCGCCNFNYGIHYHADNILSENKAIILQNYNLKDIVEDYYYSVNNMIKFFVYFPEKFGSLEQIDAYQKIILSNPDINFGKVKFVKKPLNDEYKYSYKMYSEKQLKVDIEEYKNNRGRRN